MMHRTPLSRGGFAVITVLLLAVVLGALLTAMFATTVTEIGSSRVNADITSGFYAAEAGLNIRGQLVRSEFEGYNRPSGHSPDPDEGPLCVGENTGSGDMVCQTIEINARTVTTYVLEDERNDDPDYDGRMITVPPGETFAGLSAIQYRYSVMSEAVPSGGDRPEALLEMIFRVRLVPLFQFAAFYDKDLEILPGPNMTLDGRVHANGDLYLGSNSNTLRINGQITTARRSDDTGGNVHRTRKDQNVCQGTVRVRVPGADPAGQVLPCTTQGGPYARVPDDTIETFDGQIRTRLDTLTLPSIDTFGIAGLYWNEADVRIGLDLRNGLDQARAVVLRPDLGGGQPQIDTTLTTRLETCLASDPVERGYGTRGTALRSPSEYFVDGDVRAVEWSNSFRDHRENQNSHTAANSYRQMLEVDVGGLLDCMQHDDNRNAFFANRPVGQDDIGTNRNGGLVWYFTVLGPQNPADPQQRVSTGYGVRLRNAEVLASDLEAAPAIKGLTVVSDQAVFTSGNFNGATGRAFPSDSGAPNPADGLWRPAAIMADTYHLLSGARRTSGADAGLYVTDNVSTGALSLNNRVSTATTVAAALLAATDNTPQQGGAYNGGLENYPRMHENWSGRALRYAGSFVSLGEPLRSTGQWRYGDGLYTAPNRDFNYDLRFNDASNLPPLTPRFVYLVQERFIREFDR